MSHLHCSTLRVFSFREVRLSAPFVVELRSLCLWSFIVCLGEGLGCRGESLRMNSVCASHDQMLTRFIFPGFKVFMFLTPMPAWVEMLC